VVRDISCIVCDQIVGWKYDRAHETSEHYKVGKYILEGEMISQINDLEQSGGGQQQQQQQQQPQPQPEQQQQQQQSTATTTATATAPTQGDLE